MSYGIYSADKIPHAIRANRIILSTITINRKDQLKLLLIMKIAKNY